MDILYNVNGGEILLKPLGKEIITFPAAALKARNTAGATYSQSESTTNKINVDAFIFDQTTVQHAQLDFKNDGSIKTNDLKVTLECFPGESDASNNDVVWRVRGLIRNPGDDIDVAFGTAIELTKSIPLNTKIYETEQSSVLRLGGSAIAANSTIVLEIDRYADKTEDNLDEFAGLVNVSLEINQ